MSSIPGAIEVRITDASSLSGFSSSSTDADENLSASACEINVSDTASLYPSAKARARKVASMPRSAAPPPPRYKPAKCFRTCHIRAAARFLRSRRSRAPHPAANSECVPNLCVRLALGNQVEPKLLSRCGKFLPHPDSRPESLHSESRSTTGAWSIFLDTTSITSPTSSPPPDFSISAATRSHDKIVDSKSAPRSNRCEASVCSPCRREVLRTVTGSHHADSIKNIPRLVGDHGVVAAITPASPTGFFASATTDLPKLACAPPIERLQFLAVSRFSNDEPAALSKSHIEDVRRLPISHKT